MRIYKAQTVENGIVWTTYEENGATYEGRGFYKEDWKKRAVAQRRYLSAKKKWAEADRRFTQNMKMARYAIVNHLNWSDARLDLCDSRMRKALTVMAEAEKIMQDAEKEVEAL